MAMQKKCVYMITNKINGKIYIGQSNNLKRRIQEHKHDKRKSHPIHEAIVKYGFDNFDVKVVYYGENYNEVEKEWIERLNTRDPEVGYNISIGGNDSSWQDNPTSSITKKQAFDVILDLCTSDLSISKIAKRRKVSPHTVSNINYGYSYSLPWASYPLRIDYITSMRSKIPSIINDLRNLELTPEDICNKWNIKKYQLFNINRGKTYNDPGIEYPIRSRFLTEKQRKEIIDILECSNEPFDEIALTYQVGVSTIYNINKGITYFDENRSYPIRKTA